MPLPTSKSMACPLTRQQMHDEKLAALRKKHEEEQKALEKELEECRYVAPVNTSKVPTSELEKMKARLAEFEAAQSCMQSNIARHWERLAESIKVYEEQTQYGWLFEPGFSVGWQGQRDYTIKYKERPSHKRSGPRPTQLVQTRAKESLRNKRYNQLTIADKLKLRHQPYRGGWTSRKHFNKYGKLSYIEDTGQSHEASMEENYDTIRNYRARQLGVLDGSDDFFEPGSKVMVQWYSGSPWRIATVVEYIPEHSHVLVNYDGVTKDCGAQNMYYNLFPDRFSSPDKDGKDGIKHVPRTKKFIDMLDNLTHKTDQEGVQVRRWGICLRR